MEGEILPRRDRPAFSGHAPATPAPMSEPAHEVLETDPDSRPMAPQVTHLPPSSPFQDHPARRARFPGDLGAWVARREWVASTHTVQARVHDGQQEPRIVVVSAPAYGHTPDGARQLAADLLDAADWAADRWRQELSR